MSLSIGKFVILASDDMEKWEPLMSEDVPNFVKDPDTMARLKDGDMCLDTTKDPRWFRAEELRIHAG